MPELFNLLADLPPAGAAEHFQTLFARSGLRIERIVSDGQSSPPGFWYDQPHDEWVMLVQGEAALEFEGGELRALRAGDCLAIPAHCRHRVARTAPRSVWLAVHVGEGDAA